jgi:nitroimidazol reductase NimA-like FMN-containing flavoprotein (pyridoxamine 5'-phosphate oxidase superfamily)
VGRNREKSDRPMRRAGREIVDRGTLDGILRTARVLFLAMRDQPAPYVVPVCFGLVADTVYVHSALAGTKIDLIRSHPVVGFSACTDMTVVSGPTACDCTSAAMSVVGTGRARIVEDEDERLRGLDAIMSHYAGGEPGRNTYRPGPLSRTCVIAIRIDTLRGKSTAAPDSPASAPARSE